MAKSASEYVMDALKAAGETMSLSSIGKRCAEQGVKQATACKAVQELLRKGQIVQEGRGLYALPRADVAAAVIPPPLGCGLGVAVTVTPKERVEERKHEALLAVFNNGDQLSTNDVLQALPAGWARSEAARHIRLAIEAGVLGRVYNDQRGCDVFWLRGSDTDSFALTDKGRAELAAIVATADPEPAPSAPAVRASNAIAPLNLAERLAAISTDIEDALGDACDARLGHDLIKHLVVANGAIARSARLVGA